MGHRSKAGLGYCQLLSLRPMADERVLLLRKTGQFRKALVSMGDERQTGNAFLACLQCYIKSVASHHVRSEHVRPHVPISLFTKQ